MATIRNATQQDIPRIMELYEELTGDKTDISPEILMRVFSEIAELPRHKLLVADEDGMVLGTLFLLIVPNLSHGGRPWGCIENVVVDSRCRGKGVGSQLIKSAVASCRESGCYKLQLLSNKKRFEAHQFYLATGFEDSALGFRMYI